MNHRPNRFPNTPQGQTVPVMGRPHLFMGQPQVVKLARRDTIPMNWRNIANPVWAKTSARARNTHIRHAAIRLGIISPDERMNHEARRHVAAIIRDYVLLIDPRVEHWNGNVQKP